MPELAPNTINTFSPVVALALGRVVHVRAQFGFHTVVVPSRYGGTLRIRFEDPGMRDLQVATPDGRTLAARGESSLAVPVPPGDEGRGTYLVLVDAGGAHYAIRADYTEIAFAWEASGRPLVPWNFWYFPFAPKDPELSAWAGSELQPLAKYERAFGVEGAVDWERTNHSEFARQRKDWEGHCHGAAMASVLFETPPEEGLEYAGVRFSCEELKLLATEVCARHGKLELVWHPPQDVVGTQLPSDDPVTFGGSALLGRLIEVVFAGIRDAGQPLLMDLRDESGPEDGDVTGKWNHVVYRYRATYSQDDVGDRNLMTCVLELFANADTLESDRSSSGLPARVEQVDGKPVFDTRGHRQRTLHLKFRMRFDDHGRIMVGASDNRWLWVRQGSMNTFPPRYAFFVRGIESTPTSPDDGNPLVALADVDQLFVRRQLNPMRARMGAPEGAAADVHELVAGARTEGEA